jgi:uncharacterized protein with beta-barrel porin domain
MLTCLLVLLTGTFTLAEESTPSIAYGVYVDGEGVQTVDNVEVATDDSTVTVTGTIEAVTETESVPVAGFVVNGTSSYVFNVEDGISLSGNTSNPMMGFFYVTTSADSPFAGILNAGTITVANASGLAAGLNFAVIGSDSGSFADGAAITGIINAETITVTGGSSGESAGLYAGKIGKNGSVTLGDITVTSSSEDNGAYGVHLADGGLEKAEETKGGEDDGAAQAGGQLTTGNIRVNNKSGAYGISITGEGFDEGQLNINGTIEVTSSGADAVGVELENSGETYLTVKHNIDAAAAGNAYGIRSADGDNKGDTHITLDTSYETEESGKLRITASGGESKESTGIYLQGSDDSVTIAGSNTFTNDGRAFVLSGVETLKIKTNTTLAKGSTRGTATGTDTDTATEIADNKTLQVNDTWFGGGNQVISGDDYSWLIIKNETTSTSEEEEATEETAEDDGTYGTVKSLTFQGGNIVFEAGAMLAIECADKGVTIKDNAYVVFNWDGLYPESEEDLSHYGGVFSTNTAPLNIHIDGGIVELNNSAEDPSNIWYVDTYDILIGDSGAKVVVDNGTVAARYFGNEEASTGGLTKYGAGTLIIGGSAEHDGENESGLHIAGTLAIENGTVKLGNRENPADESIEWNDEDTYSGFNTVGQIIIGQNGTLDLGHGALVCITGTEEDEEGEGEESLSPKYNVIVEGTLRVAAAQGAGIYKGTASAHEPNADTELYINGGTIEIYGTYEDVDDNGSGYFNAESVNATVGGSGAKINIAGGADTEFAIGTVTGTEGGNVVKTGAGGLVADDVNLGTGIFAIEAGKVVFNGDVTAAQVFAGNTVVKGEGGGEDTIMNSSVTFESETTGIGLLTSVAGSTITAKDDQTFGSVDIAGEYLGEDTDLTITNDGDAVSRIAGTIDLGDDGTFTVSGGTLYLTVYGGEASPVITAGDVVLEAKKIILLTPDQTAGTKQKYTVIDSDEGTISNDELALFALDNALKRQSVELGSVLVTVDLLTLDQYFAEQGIQNAGNVGNIADLIDAYGDSNTEFRGGLEELSHSEFNAVLRNMLAGELVSDAARLTMSHPWRYIFRHLDSAGINAPGDASLLGQNKEGFNTWLEFYGSSEKGSGNASVFSGYKASRWGMMLGGDVQIYSRCVAGVVFGYASPSISNELGKVSAQDISFGVYVGTPLQGSFSSNLMLGYGDQSYTYRGATGNKTDFNGNTVYASWELSRHCNVSVFELKPLAAFDFQATAMDGFTIPDLSQTLTPKDMNYFALRLGVNGKWKQLHTRLQYAHQLAGDDFAETRVSFINGTGSTALRSVQWGKDWFNAGVGGELWGNSLHWKFFADYDFEANNNTTAHTGSLKAVFTW